MFRKKPSIEVSVRHVLASDAHFEGTLKGEGGFQIDGHVTGSVTAEGKEGAILVGLEGHIMGPVSAKTVVIAGQVIGDIRAEHLVVKGTGSVIGQITATSIQVDVGAKIQGTTRCGLPAEEASAVQLGGGSQGKGSASTARSRLEKDKTEKSITETSPAVG